MIPLSSVNLGHTDALKDKYFKNKWIEPSNIKSCLFSEKWLISGEKGSGKSAIRRALVEIYGTKYLATPVVDFNNITFKALYENLVQLASATNLSKTTILSNYWQYAMLIEIIKASVEKNQEVYGLLLDNYFNEKLDASISLSERLLKVVENAWNKIDDFTGQSSKKDKNIKGSANLIASAGLTAKLINEINQYPITDQFIKLRNLFFEKIEINGDRIVLILDGFDKLRNDGAPAAAIRLIFDSLVDAIQSIYAYPNLPDLVEIKAFLPHDRYLSLSLRDYDKVDTMHVTIRWNSISLQEFIKKRLELAPKLQGTNFTNLWRQVMPETVYNVHYRLWEDSFEYILRHTMMRPRQLLIHLEHLSAMFHDVNIDPSGIPKTISDSSKEIARHFIGEFSIDFPHIERFVGYLNGKENIIEYSDLRKIISDYSKRYPDSEQAIDIDKKIDILYSIGFFGIIHFIGTNEVIGDIYCPPSKEASRHYVEFFYKNPHSTISTTLNENSLIGFHPIWVDYAKLKPHPTLIIG